MSARLERIQSRARDYAHTQELWTWWELPLEQTVSQPLPEGCRALAASDEQELQWFLALPPVWYDARNADPRLRIEQGGTPWLVRDDRQVLFTVWQFVGRAPLQWLRSGWLTLPTGTALLEDAIVAPDRRGRGIAGGMATRLAEQLGAQGVSSFIARILKSNAPSIKMIQKAGYRPVAESLAVHTGPLTRVSAWTVDSGGINGAWLAETLDGERFLRWRGEPIEPPHWARRRD
jgi:RimJ/RimL family protein N-acetyltransferase